MVAGTLTYETKLDTKNFQNGIDDINGKVQAGGTKMKSIIGALGIAKLIQSGINLISNSLDAAISRLDIMNNFDKVMSNLGISASQSRKAINDLSEGLQGLPTTLDAGALAVQRFTSKNMDIKKSTEMFLALNNAILAGGASTQIQESAIEQLSQAYSKGKMDMMEWRTLQMAMPAQLRQVADAMGLDVDALGEMMRQGDETDKVMDAFINTIVELNEKGGKNIKTFKEQAKNATNGIRTNITNMKTAVARGVAKIIDSLDKGLKKANLGGLGKLIADVGKTIENVLKNVSRLISKIDFGKLFTAMQKLVPVIGAVVAGFIAYEATLKAIQLINIISNILGTVSAFMSLIPAITSAKDAMILLDMAMDANPIGLVVGAVAALTAGLVLLATQIGKTDDEYAESNAKLKEYEQTMRDAEDARQEYLNNNMPEIKHYEDLAKELSLIVDANGKVKEGYEDRARFIVGELNDALGLELQMTGDVITNYNTLRDAIGEIIEAKRAQVLLEAEEEKYDKALEKRDDLEKAYSDAVAKTAEKTKEKNKFLEEMAKQYGVGEENLKSFLMQKMTDLSLTQEERDNYSSLLEQYNGYISSVEKATENENKQYEAYQKNEEIIGKYETALGYLEEKNYGAITKMYQDTTFYSGATNDTVIKNLDARIKAQEKYLKDLESDTKITDERMREYMISQGEQVLEDLKTQYNEREQALKINNETMCATTKEGQDEINELLDGGQKKSKSIWDMSLAEQIKTLQDKNVEFKKTADGNIQAYIDGVESGEPKSVEEANEFANKITDEINKAQTDANTAGKNIVLGTQYGIQNRSAQNGAFNAISSFGAILLSRLRSALQEHSPSKATRQYGQYLLQGLGLGIEDEENDVLNQIDDFGEEVLDRMENAVNLETGKMSFDGTSGSVNQILSANAQFEGTIPMKIDLDGETIYNNQQKISARKNLQYGGAR